MNDWTLTDVTRALGQAGHEVPVRVSTAEDDAGQRLIGLQVGDGAVAVLTAAQVAEHIGHLRRALREVSRWPA